MRYKLLHYYGFNEAINGARLSYGRTSFDNFESPEEDKVRLSNQLACMDGGHNGFLEFIQYWILIQAPLRWWKQMDRYRHLSQISESTMHLSWKGGLIPSDFEKPELIYPETLKRLNDDVHAFCNCTPEEKDKKKKLEDTITLNLPDGYLQTRLVCANAKCLRNIYFQRRNHKLKEWQEFCEWIRMIPHGNLITTERNKND